MAGRLAISPRHTVAAEIQAQNAVFHGDATTESLQGDMGNLAVRYLAAQGDLGRVLRSYL